MVLKVPNFPANSSKQKQPRERHHSGPRTWNLVASSETIGAFFSRESQWTCDDEMHSEKKKQICVWTAVQSDIWEVGIILSNLLELCKSKRNPLHRDQFCPPR